VSDDRSPEKEALPETPVVEIERASATSPFGYETPVLRALKPLAAFGIATLLLARVISPAFTGLGVGLGIPARLLELAAAIASQVFAFTAMMAAILMVLAASRSRLPVGVRIAALTLGGFAILPTVWAFHQPVPPISAALVAGCTSVLALAAAPTALRAPFARAAGLVLALIGMGGVVRLAAIGFALASARWAALSRGIASASFVVDAIAIAVAIAWISARNKKLTSPVTLALLALALFFTRQALSGAADEARTFDLFFWRAAQRLGSRPDALFPLGVRVFVGFLAPLAAIAALLARDTLGPLAGGIALALAAHGAIEMPPCALMLLVGALAVALTAEGGVWSALGKSRS
jgi:hypothetical protein